jgi:hypothetical protein
MKLRIALLIVTLLTFLGIGSQATAVTLFTENFETTLSAWTGKSSGAHHGQIVADPTGTSNSVLNFFMLNSAGDIFTTGTSFSSTGNQFILSFDYYGKGSESGGFIGYSYDLPGSHVWLAGSDTDYPGVSYLTGDNAWHHYVFTFTTLGQVHLMLEDFVGSDTVAGNAYFDNIVLTDANGPSSSVPEPSSLLLLGSGLAGMALMRRRSRV